MTQEAFVSHVSASRRRLLRLARTMLPAADCEDAVQSAILSAWEHLPQLRDEASFDAWLSRILVNQCRAIRRDNHSPIRRPGSTPCAPGGSTAIALTKTNRPSIPASASPSFSMA